MGWWFIFSFVSVFLLVNVGASRNLTVLRDPDYPPQYLLDIFKTDAVKCRNETDIEDEVITKFRDDEDFEGTVKLGCYLYCIFREKELWMHEKNELHVMKIVDLVPPGFEKTALKMGLRCMKVKGKNNCERSLWYHFCWKKNDPEHYFLL